jgi:hypothetical protein
LISKGVASLFKNSSISIIARLRAWNLEESAKIMIEVAEKREDYSGRQREKKAVVVVDVW